MACATFHDLVFDGPRHCKTETDQERRIGIEPARGNQLHAAQLKQQPTKQLNLWLPFNGGSEAATQQIPLSFGHGDPKA
jgi:hypothetical protein